MYTTVIRERNWCSNVSVLYSSQKKETCALYTTVLKEKGTGALLLMFSGEGDWSSTVLRRRAMGLYLLVFISFIYIKP